MRGGVTDAGRQTTKQTLEMELLSQWKLEAEFRNNGSVREGLLNDVELGRSWEEFAFADLRHNYVDRLPSVVEAANIYI